MIRVLVAEDHEIVRAGLKDLLTPHKDFVVAGEASSGAEALKLLSQPVWALVLLDSSMPDMNGVDTLKRIKRSNPALPVLILTTHPEGQFAIHMLRAGASGYVCKECAPEELANAIIMVASGRKYVSPALRDQLAGDLCGDTESARHTKLSD